MVMSNSVKLLLKMPAGLKDFCAQSAIVVITTDTDVTVKEYFSAAFVEPRHR